MPDELQEEKGRDVEEELRVLKRKENSKQIRSKLKYILLGAAVASFITYVAGKSFSGRDEAIKTEERPGIIETIGGASKADEEKSYSGLDKKIKDNEKTIFSFREELAKAQHDLESSKSAYEAEIQTRDQRIAALGQKADELSRQIIKEKEKLADSSAQLENNNLKSQAQLDTYEKEKAELEKRIEALLAENKHLKKPENIVANNIEAGSSIIVYSNEDLFITNGKGENPKNLTQGKAEKLDVKHPRISPDKTKIVFQSRDKSYLINLDGTGLEALERGQYPEWSPDGKEISYIIPGKGLFRLDLETKTKKMLHEGYITEHVWYLDTPPDDKGLIYLLNGKLFWSKNKKRLTSVFSNCCTPSVSPDFEHVFYSANRNIYAAKIRFRTDLGDRLLLTKAPQNELMPDCNSNGEVVFYRWEFKKGSSSSPLINYDRAKRVYSARIEVPVEICVIKSNPDFYQGTSYQLFDDIFALELESGKTSELSKNLRLIEKKFPDIRTTIAGRPLWYENGKKVLFCFNGQIYTVDRDAKKSAPLLDEEYLPGLKDKIDSQKWDSLLQADDFDVK